MSTVAIIVAAGSGIRAGGEKPKQYQEIGGEPVLRHTLRAFAEHPGIDHIQAVIGSDHARLFAQAAQGMDVEKPVIGGASRQESVRNGLYAIERLSPKKVLIHDAARPFASRSLISHIIANLDRMPAVVPGLAVTDTLKRAPGGKISETVSREQLWAVQTPQGFRYAEVRDAHAAAEAQAVADLTDDASVAEWYGMEVAVIAGEPTNRKLTLADDITEADRQMTKAAVSDLADIRVGQGYDVHAFEAGDHVILCGIAIPHDQALKGHSDADVAMHALTDAILGTISEGDIGKHFPPSDEQWKAANSEIFLRAAADLVEARKGIISHCDVTIVCETPKLRPHIDPMRSRLAEILQISVDRVSVKATTSEQLGFTGRREGIAAHATATVRLPL